MPLRVGLVAPPWVPVPPRVYGGTELVIDQLARGLAAMGCDVVLFATGDSTCDAPRRWHYPEALGTTAHPSLEVAHVRSAYAELDGAVDVIHDHTVAGPIRAAVLGTRTPVVTTVHGLLTAEVASHIRSVPDRLAVVAISHAQRRSAPWVSVTCVIHHGVDVGSFPLGRGDGGYVLFLGRMSADKGVHRAIDIARAAGRPILIAAKMWEPDEHRYFVEIVQPMLGRDAVFLGEVGGRRKLELLAGAEALVNPIRWPEPFGLVMLEALACGTPVLAFPEGAAPEIVEHGATGFLCRDEADMTTRLRDARDLDRRRCRESVARRFSTAGMVERYLALYRWLLDGARRRAASAAPVDGHPDASVAPLAAS
jgi:glycosyltransferase involved in cell wall biosynthesis